MINTLQSLAPGRLHLKNICGQFERGMLLVNTAARTKWPDSEDNKRRSSKTDGLFLIELPDAARSKLVT